MTHEPRLEEQLVSLAVQAGLSNQLDSADAIEVDVKTDLLKATQGQADSVSISGQGMVVQDVRVEEVELQVDHVAINPLSVLLGKLKLSQPLDAAAKVTLTEADLNRAMNSDAVAQRIPPLKLRVAGEPVTVELLRPMQVQIPADGKLYFVAQARLHETQGTRQLEFAIVAYPRTESHPIRLESFTCSPGQAVSLEFILALMQQFKEWLDLPYLDIGGSAIRVKQMTVEAGKLTIETEAYVRQVPDL